MGGQPEADCRARLERLFDYLDEELDAGAAAALERHLDDCPCCGDLAVSLKRTIASCRAAGTPPLPRRVQARARARVRELLAERAAPRRGR